MLHEIIRLTTQHRALHCYLLLSLWIFLLIAGLYKFLEQPSQTHHHRSKPFDLSRSETLQIYKSGVKARRIFKSCNRLEDLVPDAEGTVNISHWTLKGIIIVMRHGDRGPLQHIRNISNVNCGTLPNQLLHTYQNYIHNISLTGRMAYMQTGAFHGFPYLPSSPNQCSLGQLTMQGIAQLLKTGQILQKSYGHLLKFNNMTMSDVVVYCTRYRRTFQSVLALLFPLIPVELFNKIVIRESPSMSFCFSDCACSAADYFMRQLTKQVRDQLTLHPAVVRLVRQAAALVFEQPDEALTSNPLALRDALLTYICHDSLLPCATATSSSACLKTDHVSALFAYTEWDNHQRWKNKHWRNACLLKSYGLFKNIVSYMLKMASEPHPKVVVYSGHDYTLQYLSIALGISNEHASLQFASRLIIEVYQNEGLSHTGPKGFYFKLLVNGKDVTREMTFCRNFESVTGSNYFCRMEDIVRFIHDDYFAGLNVTNFKDACIVHTDKDTEQYV